MRLTHLFFPIAEKSNGRKVRLNLAEGGGGGHTGLEEKTLLSNKVGKAVATCI